MGSKETIDRLKMRGETAASKVAFLDYLNLGPKRSLNKLWKQYRDPEKYDQDMDSPNAPPTRQLKTLQLWSSAFSWQARLKQVTDEQIEVIMREQRRALAAAYNEKYARPEERIKVLNQLAEMLVDHLVEHNLITAVVKQVGSGKNTKMVEEEKVDVPTIQALRGILDDLAKETGGRPKIGTVSGKIDHDHHAPEGPIGQGDTVFIFPAIESLPIEAPEEIVDTEAIDVTDS